MAICAPVRTFSSKIPSFWVYLSDVLFTVAFNVDNVPICDQNTFNFLLLNKRRRNKQCFAYLKIKNKNIKNASPPPLPGKISVCSWGEGGDSNLVFYAQER